MQRIPYLNAADNYRSRQNNRKKTRKISAPALQVHQFRRCRTSSGLPLSTELAVRFLDAYFSQNFSLWAPFDSRELFLLVPPCKSRTFCFVECLISPENLGLPAGIRRSLLFLCFSPSLRALMPQQGFPIIRLLGERNHPTLTSCLLLNRSVSYLKHRARWTDPKTRLKPLSPVTKRPLLPQTMF